MDEKTIKYICNILRQGTTTWEGRNECINRGRRQRAAGYFLNGRQKFVWENNCELCGVWYDLKDNLFEVDHIIEIGPFKGCFNDFIKRMFCGQENLQRLCISCHKKKTSKFNATLTFKRKETATKISKL